MPGAARRRAGSAGGPPVAYVEALRARGQLEPMDDPIQMGLPPAGPPSCGATSRCSGCGGTLPEPAGRSRPRRRSTPPASGAAGPSSTWSRWPGRGTRADLRGQPDHAAALPGAAAAGGHRPRGRRPPHGAGLARRRRRPGRRRRGRPCRCGATRSSGASPSTGTRRSGCESRPGPDEPRARFGTRTAHEQEGGS